MEVTTVHEDNGRHAARSLGRAARVLLVVASLCLGWGCTDEPDEPDEPRSVEPTVQNHRDTIPPPGDPTDEPEPPAPKSPDPPLVVFLGDSLTAGLGLAEEQAFPALVGEKLAARGTAIRVVNAGVSGDTTAGGSSRLAWLLRQEPDLLVLELGVNDALRGQPVDEIEANLRTIVTRAREAGVPTLLLGLQIPPSYGREYAERYREIYPRISRDLDVPLVPFLLEGVAGDPALNLPDGIHPTAEGHEVMADVVVDHLEPLVND